jgi:LacI family transcriptional regulator
MSKVSLKQLAATLGVSISTVSKAMRNSYEISEETRRRVIEKAREIGYNPNPYAGSLRHHKSKTIAMVVPELTNNFFIQAISGAESVAREKDYHILVYNTMDDHRQEESIIRHLQNGRVDGVIMSLASSTVGFDHLTDLIHSGIPIIFFDRICHEIETAKVTTDDFTSAFRATEHLIASGCRDIAYLSLSENLSIDNKRRQGFLEALSKHDIRFNPERIIKCGQMEKLNHSRIRKLLESPKPPDGIFASVEKLALTTYYVCKEIRRKIPDALKVICFSNLRTAPLLNPSLTTITQPALEIGASAATVLFKYLDKKRPVIQNENIILRSELIIRGSTVKKAG